MCKWCDHIRWLPTDVTPGVLFYKCLELSFSHVTNTRTCTWKMYFCCQQCTIRSHQCNIDSALHLLQSWSYRCFAPQKRRITQSAWYVPSSMWAPAISICRRCFTWLAHWKVLNSRAVSDICGTLSTVSSLYSGCATRCSNRSPVRCELHKNTH